ncbi:VWA domain-containing protein [Vulcanisaeta souniana]|uniref:Magnesium chelatase n=2 Tax=Vulcanisaeta souniana TaxID=164452 RepID=A0A830E7S4_9CREN|nr:VWA domain-containing protein [Vulcanisaeta souniana]BDR91594.1 magnesium chelatase [Vulcanisaeta souniana JCM 11219]GGI72041.1 magnesium chelatase [Vulcanisaeta souniana JCM 11219]
MSRRVVFPFPAIVGMDKAKLALIAVAVNPLIGGVLLRGDKGTGKTTLVRSFADVLPEIEVVADCPFNCDPHDPQLMCDSCYVRYQRGEKLPITIKKMRVIDLPLSITVDRLVGTLDIKRAITEGVRALQPGLLAEANRNILYIDEVNLLDDYIIDILLDAAAYGWNVVEREGVSVKHPARFILVASMNPEEGELRPQLLDRFGLIVDVEAPRDQEVRAEIVRRVEEFNRDPEGFYRRWEPEIKKIREGIRKARELVKRVEMPDDLLKTLVETIIKLDIRTSRAEIVTTKTAKALAALEGRTRVTMEDLQRAMELALPHRLKARPFERPKPPILPQPLINDNDTRNEQPGQTPNQRGGMSRDGMSTAQDEHSNAGTGGNVGGADGNSRRYGVASVGIPVEFRKEFIHAGSHGLGSRSSFRRIVGQPHGIPYMYLPISNKEGSADVDLTASIVHAALRGAGLPIKVDWGDLMVRVRRVRAPRISLIVLDASGSMNFMRRIEVAKGLVRRIAEESYVKRSYVGLISFRGRGVDVIIEPTRNYWQVLSTLEGLPSGGATPLSAALACAVDLIKRLGLKLRGDYWVYVITDGKANVPLMRDVREELESFMVELSRLAKVVIYNTRPQLIYDPSITYIDVLSKYAVDTVRVGD